MSGGGVSARALAGAFAGLLLLSASAAFALPGFRKAAIQQFHYDRENPLWELDRRVMACTYCHVREAGGAPWNPFGQALQAQFVKDARAGQRQKFPQVLHDLLKAGQDADGDGFTDALEVFARTLPGDPKSKPEQSVADLQAAFEQAGGAAQYAPAKAKK